MKYINTKRWLTVCIVKTIPIRGCARLM